MPGLEKTFIEKRKAHLMLKRTTLSGVGGIFIACLAMALILMDGWQQAAAQDTLALDGKIYYRAVRKIKNHYPGEIVEINVKNFQQVSQDEVLATYRITREQQQELQHEIDFTSIQKTKISIEEVMTEINKKEREKRSVTNLVNEGLASPMSGYDLAEDIQVLILKKKYLEEELAYLKRQQAREKDRISEELGGVSLASGIIPRVIPITTKLPGYVVKMGVIPTSKIEKNRVCFEVTKLSLILIRCKVYEEDYIKLSLGQKAVITSQGAPGKEYTAHLSRLPLRPTDKGYEALSYYLVDFIMPNPDLKFRAGNRVKVKVDLTSKVDPLAP
ncbi:efflux RND transporter periplasmic adaptor subunit [Pseudodesulfovibrio methanolicus]|uniref:Efflux RND transporter periplasmic adaptor subunit n=1 Tax=Pseudodesulfovibrio methanolicus TaxID=3126690 RepID=A0ABZ2IYW6_9BACT